MDQQSLISEVMAVASDVFGVPVSELSATSSPEQIQSWDSISHLNLILSLEQHFGVSFAPETIAELISVQKIADELHSLRS